MSAVIVSLRVAATPERAFDAFVGEIGAWWRAHPLFPVTPTGDGRLGFEGRERLIATAGNGERFEIGRVRVWAPGERLSFSWRPPNFGPDHVTEVEVRFEAVGGETRVTVEHRGWDALPQAHSARHGFPLGPLQMRLAEQWRAALAALAGITSGQG
jgi:uncharacterized protein YndB with AHSA1/START domain